MNGGGEAAGPRWSWALDIGGTHVSAGAVDLAAGRIVPESRITLPVDSAGSAEAILAAWTQAASHAIATGRRWAASAGAGERTRPAGGGLAMPGPFDYERGVCWIKGVNKYEALYGMNIREILVQRLGLGSDEPLVFRNDAVCFLLGECAWGAARGARNVIAVTLGTGLGSAFQREGRVVESGPGVPPEGWFYSTPWGDGTAEDCFSTRGLLRRYGEAGGTPAAGGVKELAGRADAGEVLARRVFSSFGRELGEFLAPWARAMPAEVIVVGGNIARAWAWFGSEVQSALAAEAPAVRVRRTALWEDAALLGAAWLPI
ncbi:MAG: ROK family protein [Candidatus Sumerlaeia bacterium]